MVAAVGLGFGALYEPVVGIAAVTVGFGLIYLRGYVVPGTPVLTQRFLPDAVLRYFEHGGPKTTTPANGGDSEFDPETELLTAGALAPCLDRDDLCLDSLFRTSWRSEMAPAAEDLDDAIYRLLPSSFDDSVDVGFRGGAVVTQVSGTTVAEWPSRAAFVADAAGAAALAEVDSKWADRGFQERTKLLGGLRLWLDRCSICDGSVELSEDTVESCCRSVNVVEASCTSCGARIFEAELPDESLS
ncbi:hypothetical protein [Halolamina sp. CBA1230]|uniref:hypothetical protein n=1 Tax=Halolamina sp. CBA1230 TaxID=1853690 RepID=UPI001C3E7105|nr:hypothetical protein [Halolamina sp. CBA1230]